METQLQSLSKIFTERLFRIPDYQRGYAWTEKQVADFWNDLIQLPEDKNHYVGVLTLESVPSETYSKWEDDLWIIKSKSFFPYYIVDGQQRLTTSIILIQCIQELLYDNKKVNYTSREEICKKFIYESKDNGISKSFIFGYEKDNPSYEYLKVKILNQNSDSNFTIQETKYTSNLEYAKSYFTKQLSTLELNDIEKIYKKVTQSFLFNIYTISSDIDVFIAFETMNNRGKRLSYLELLKNRLIYLSTMYNVEDYEKERLRKNINECWKDIYQYLGKNKNNPLSDDDFLSSHFYLYFCKELSKRNSVDDENIDDDDVDVDGNDDDVDSDTNYRTYHRLSNMSSSFYSTYLLDKKFIFNKLSIDNNDNTKLTINYINKYVNNIKRSVKYWYFVHNPLDSNFSSDIIDYLVKINRICNRTTSTLLMVFLETEKNHNTIISFLKLLERYNFILSMYSRIYRLNSSDLFNENLYAEKLFNKQISATDLTKKLNDCINKLISNKDFIDEIRDSFNRTGFYHWSGIKYFLYEYEQDIKFKSKNDRDKLIWNEYITRDYQSIEHIYPQNPRNEYWLSRFKQYTTDQRNSIKNSLGNLVPISQAKNSSLNNKPFPEKIGSEITKVGYKYGSYSEIELTNYTEWSAETILDRGIKLLDFLEQHWDIKLSSNSRADKAYVLGLDFIL